MDSHTPSTAEEKAADVASWKARDAQRAETGVVLGYMCKVDFDHELGEALGGNTVYPTLADLISNHKSTDECGIVEVEIRLKQVIKECDFSIKPDKIYQVSSKDENGKFTVAKISGKDLLERRKK